MTYLAIALALLASPMSPERRWVRIQEPSWTEGEISVDARLYVLARIVPAESLEDVWLELRNPGGLWERQAAPTLKYLRVSDGEAIAAVALEPRRMPGIRVGDEFRLRICALYPNGEHRASPNVVVRVVEAERREADLLDRLSRSTRNLMTLREGFEQDHRRLCRLMRRSTDAAALDRDAEEELTAMDDRWIARFQEIRKAAGDLRSILEGAATDRFVDPSAEERYRKLSARVSALASEDGPSSSFRENLELARRASGPERRRKAFHAALDAEDRFMESFEKEIAAVNDWRERIEFRRAARSILEAQKMLNGELDRERRR